MTDVYSRITAEQAATVAGEEMRTPDADRADSTRRPEFLVQFLDSVVGEMVPGRR